MPTVRNCSNFSVKDLVARDDQGRMAVHRAAHEGNVVDLRNLLKENGADINAKDNNGMTPLHCAATAGHEEIV